MRGGVDLKKQMERDLAADATKQETGNKMKETDGIEWKEGGRCKRVGKKGAAAAIKEEKKGELVQACASADGASQCYC